MNSRAVLLGRALMALGLVMALLLLALAPWLDDQEVHDKVFEERAWKDGTIDRETGELICDYIVSWAPFGRWVASCEGGYYVAFWGEVLPPLP